jgi:hypothetical protein
MQPNNPNPYYPPREPIAPPVASVGNGQPAPTFSGLPKSGPAWGWIITTVLLVLLLLGALGFAFWAFGERQDYKNNSDKKAAAAVEVAKKQQIDVDNKRFAEELKNPLKTYVGPDSYGSVSVQYPKTWSGYVSTSSSTNGALIDGYFHPDIVPGLSSSGGGTGPAIALRIQVINQAYSQVVNKYSSAIKQGTLTATPYALPKMPEQIGTKFEGQLSSKLNGTEVVIPLRDKTLLIGTDTDQYLADFNTYILPNISFVP